MQNPFFSPLTRRLTLLIVSALVITASIILYRSSSILEDAMLEQTKRQANVFMHGVEAQLHTLADPSDPAALQRVIEETMQSDKLAALDFSIYQMYFFDRHGKIIAHSRPGPHPDKVLDSRYDAVFNRFESLVDDKVELIVDPQSGQEILKTDVIVPHHLDSGIFAALEVEIDLNKTLQVVRTLDDRYENEIYAIISGSIIATLLFIGFVIYRWTLIPIRKLAEVTSRISNGELEARVEQIRQKDELGQLCHSVNQMADSIELLFNEQETAHIQMMQSLSKALEAKDAYTAGHSGRVAAFSVRLGKRIGLDQRELTLLKQGALMHDLGKIGIPDAILNKPGTLTEDEYLQMKKHPVNTAIIMRPLQRFKEFREIAAWHHERWDGHGYPDGLHGEEIPLLARIVCIADTWDAMTGDRVYRKGMTVAKAVEILRQERYSGQWDPALIGEFITMIEEMQNESNDNDAEERQ